MGRTKRSVIKVQDDDSAFRAVVVAQFKDFDGPSVQDWEVMRKNKGNIQSCFVKLLAKRAGIKMGTIIGIPQWRKIQKALPDYRIVIVDSECKTNRFFVGPEDGRRIYIERCGNHYNAITNIKGYMRGSKGQYYCEECNVLYSHRTNHRCSAICPQCLSAGQCMKYDSIICSHCEREYNGKQCYDNHIGATCRIYKKCNNKNQCL